jgi:hypothetical protein
MSKFFIINRKYFQLFIVVAIVFASGFLIVNSAKAVGLTCDVRTAAACSGGTNVIVLKMSSATNAHAATSTWSNTVYNNNVICCSGVVGLGTDCSGTYATVININAAGGNSHVSETNGGSYPTRICLRAPTGGSVSVNYAANCSGYDTTVGSITAAANSHIGNSSWAAGTIKICATAAIAPPIPASYTNNTETGLNYSAACTNCGARLGTVGTLQTITITGTNFGADPGAGNRSTAANHITVGNHQIVDANVTAWSATSITFTTDIANDSDSSWGTEFGGATALKVTAGSQTSSGLNFYVFPQITSIATNTGVSNGAREYNSSDNHGVITLYGTRFGSSQGTGYARLLGCDATTCSSPSGSVTIDSWSNTSIQARVPTVIGDGAGGASDYTGSVAILQGTGSNSKTYSFSSLRVLPRITSLSVDTGAVGDSVTLYGNHFCQNNGSCPTAFDSNNQVVFYSSVPATVFTSWSNTSMATKVPSGATLGTYYLYLKSYYNTYTYSSNNQAFTVVTTVPTGASNLRQYKSDGTTQIATGTGKTNETTVKLKADLSAQISIAMILQVEVKKTGTAFDGTGIVDGSGCTGTSCLDAVATVSGLTDTSPDGQYKWRARTKNTTTQEVSDWTNFNGSTGFIVDLTGPVISNIFASPGSNSVTVTWDTSAERSTTQLQYNKTGTFGSCPTDCTTITDTPADTNGKFTDHSVSLSNLDSGTKYYYRVRSQDGAGNESYSDSDFTTSNVTQPGKTTSFFIIGEPTAISSETTTYFTVLAPETNPTPQNVFVEISGIVSGGSNPIGLQVNSLTSVNYAVSASSPTQFKFIYPISTPSNEANLNLNDASPCTNGSGNEAPCNKLIITPGSGMSINITSAIIFMTYGYTP